QVRHLLLGPVALRSRCPNRCPSPFQCRCGVPARRGRGRFPAPVSARGSWRGAVKAYRTRARNGGSTGGATARFRFLEATAVHVIVIVSRRYTTTPRLVHPMVTE